MNQTVVSLKRNIEFDYAYNEAIKTLRTNLQFCGSNIKVIMFTSAMPDEGKSDISFNAAASLAQIGKKVLVIDADIRKSVLASRYHVDTEIVGLSQYLTGQRPLDEVIYPTKLSKLHVIFAGPYSPNPAELLEEDLFTRMLDKLRPQYDYIIIDTPPMANLIDGAIVARLCDGVVMVIESGAVSYRLEQKVKQQIENSGCRILGVVLNKVDIRSESYYGKYGKYAKYGKYGKYKKYDKYDHYGMYGGYNNAKDRGVISTQKTAPVTETISKKPPKLTKAELYQTEDLAKEVTAIINEEAGRKPE